MKSTAQARAAARLAAVQALYQIDMEGTPLASLLDDARFLPGQAGLLVADRYDAAVVREASTRPLAPACRKAETLRFARRAARRLSASIDPSLGDDR